MVKNTPDNAGDARDVGSIPGSGRPPGKGNSNPFHILGWEIPRTEPGGLQPMRSQEPAATERLNNSSLLAEQGKLTSVFYADSLEKRGNAGLQGICFSEPSQE